MPDVIPVNKVVGLTTSYGRPGKNQATIALSDTTHFELDLSQDFTQSGKVVQVSIFAFVDFYWTYSEEDNITARIASDSTRQKLAAGGYSFDVMGASGRMGFLSAGAATPQGLSYTSYFGA